MYANICIIGAIIKKMLTLYAIRNMCTYSSNVFTSQGNHLYFTQMLSILYNLRVCALEHTQGHTGLCTNIVSASNARICIMSSYWHKTFLEVAWEIHNTCCLCKLRGWETAFSRSRETVSILPFQNFNFEPSEGISYF